MFKRKYSGKYYVPTHRRRKPKCKKQQHLIIAIIAILCSIISCVSLAFLFTETNSIKNEFENAYVARQVLENGPDGKGEFDGQTKTNVRIKNTGDVQSYIRAAVVVTWMSEDQSKVTANKPQVGSDYSIAALVASQCGVPLRFAEDRDISRHRKDTLQIRWLHISNTAVAGTNDITAMNNIM